MPILSRFGRPRSNLPGAFFTGSPHERRACVRGHERARRSRLAARSSRRAARLDPRPPWTADHEATPRPRPTHRLNSMRVKTRARALHPTVHAQRPSTRAIFQRGKHPAPNSAGSCASQDLDALAKKAADPNATLTDLFNVVGDPTCSACVFSAQGDPNWQPIVWSPDQASGDGFVNIGSCYAVANGGSAACGKGAQDDEFCEELVCDAACTSPACAASAMDGPWRLTHDAKTDGCGSAIDVLNAECSDFIDAARDLTTTA